MFLFDEIRDKTNAELRALAIRQGYADALHPNVQRWWLCALLTGDAELYSEEEREDAFIVTK